MRLLHRQHFKQEKKKEGMSMSMFYIKKKENIYVDLRPLRSMIPQYVHQDHSILIDKWELGYEDVVTMTEIGIWY